MARTADSPMARALFPSFFGSLSLCLTGSEGAAMAATVQALGAVYLKVPVNVL